MAVIFAMAFGITYNWPDFLHTNYGFPLVWGTHTLNTIAGPIDKWNVDILNLALDLVFWLGAMVASISIVESYLRK